jgi:hypothetical protein
MSSMRDLKDLILCLQTITLLTGLKAASLFLNGCLLRVDMRKAIDAARVSHNGYRYEHTICLTGSSRGDTQSACRFDRTYDEESLLREGRPSTSKGNIWCLMIAQVDTATSENWRGLLLVETNGKFQRIDHCREYPNLGELRESVWANVERKTIELI